MIRTFACSRIFPKYKFLTKKIIQSGVMQRHAIANLDLGVDALNLSTMEQIGKEIMLTLSQYRGAKVKELKILWLSSKYA